MKESVNNEHSQEVESMQLQAAESTMTSVSPPPLDITAGPLQRQEAPSPTAETTTPEAATPETASPATTTDTPDAPATVDPYADLAAEHRNPLENSNTVFQNLQLLISQWEANDATGDDRKLANILATAMLESGRTFQSVNENLSTGYFPAGYAPTGYWGRGFVQLTHEYNYEDMGTELGVDMTGDDERRIAALPTISAYTTANGMLDGDFTGRDLNRYLTSTQNEDGEWEQEAASDNDWFNSRRVVNGVSSDPEEHSYQAAENIRDNGQSIYRSITAYRTGITDGSIEATVTLATYLYTETTHFDNFADSDGLRMVEALGYMDFQTPNMSGGTEMQQSYETEVSEAGHASSLASINRDDERDAIQAFQRDFNANHNLETPLPEDGNLDDRTLEMMLLGGNRIVSGENMIDYAFSGNVEATDLYQDALQRFQAGTIGIEAFALEIHSYMPAHEVNDVLGIFDTLGDQATNFALYLARAGNTHDRLAIMNTEVLTRMQALFTASTDADHQAQLIRVQAVLNYEPAEGEYTTYVVVRGDTLGRIAARYGMRYQDLGELNGIADPYPVSVGQVLQVPNANYDPEATPSPAASTIDPLTVPAEAPTPDPTPEATPDGATEAASEAAPTTLPEGAPVDGPH